MNKNQIEYYIGDIGYLVNDLIESEAKRKEILTHLRELSNSCNTEKAISYLADELVLPVVQVFFINSHDKEQIAVTCDSENYINSVPYKILIILEKALFCSPVLMKEMI